MIESLNEIVPALIALGIVVTCFAIGLSQSQPDDH